MKKIGTACLSLAFAMGLATSTQSDQAYLAILAETHLMRIVGMPQMPEMPEGMEMPEGVGMPMMPGSATRTLNIRLWSPSIAPEGAKASIVPPAGLKQGNRLDLELYRPKPQQTTADPSTPGFDPDSNPEFTLKIYWGSSEIVREGQPRVIKWGGLTPEQKAEMKRQAAEAQKGGGSYFYKPNWTTGYWPTGKQRGRIAKDASLVGSYELTTTYTGNVTVEAPSNVNFLPPIEMTQPPLDKKIGFEKPIAFQWSALPNALGQFASIMGMEGKNTMILWSSSENYVDSLMGDMGFMQMADVRERVQQNVFMAPTTTKMTVPAGIFQNADMAMLMMVAYGPGSALEKGQPLPRVQTKSTLNIMLGGKQMNDMFEDE